jgi:hypothetical protein
MERDTLENGEIGGSILLLVLGTCPFILTSWVLSFQGVCRVQGQTYLCCCSIIKELILKFC